MSRLYHLVLLEVFSIAGNPCASTTSDPLPADFFRPFVINWLPGLKVLDEWPVGAKEGLAAEWLYSLGRGRQFKPGQHDELLAYLASVRSEVTTSGPEDESAASKMDKILSLAQQHQQQLAASAGAAAPSVPSPSPVRKAVANCRKNPYPLRNQKGSTPPKDPPMGMSTSSTFTTNKTARPASVDVAEELLSAEPMPALMAQSLDPAAAHVALTRSGSQGRVNSSRPSRPVSASHDDGGSGESTGLRRSTSSAANNGAARRPLSYGSPRPASRPSSSTKQPASKLPVHLTNGGTVKSLSRPAQTVSSSSRSSHEQVKAAVTIQKIWRGYQVRNLDPSVRQIKSNLRAGRTEQHVVELGRQLAVVAKTNGTADDDESVKDSVARLQRDVLELQQSMQQVLDWIGSSSSHHHQPIARPRTLALKQPEQQQQDDQPQHPVETFAQGMASDLIRQSVSGGTEPGTI